jgi:hypothetical protein
MVDPNFEDSLTDKEKKNTLEPGLVTMEVMRETGYLRKRK